ncbi:MAG: putative ketoacyl reductase [Elusimicrobia bacterium]|nr:putative ketoacyl reductase [Elusimicrobiota bacterium]
MARSSSRDVLVTGANGVIGSAIARELASSGFRLHLTARKPSKLSPLVSELKLLTQENIYVDQLELTDPKGPLRVIKNFFSRSVRPFGLVCNAGGFGALGPFSSIEVQKWIDDFSENFFCNTRLIHAFVRQAKVKRIQEGSLVVLSGAGLGGDTLFENFSCYSTAKASLTHLVEALWPELLKQGLRINAISPGQVYSQLTETMIQAGTKRVGRLALSAKECKKTGGVPPELAARLVNFLLSPASNGITGRLLSARYDYDLLAKDSSSIAKDSNRFRMRRIDNTFFRQILRS